MTSIMRRICELDSIAGADRVPSVGKDLDSSK